MSKSILLNSGFEIPVVGLGTWKSQTGEVGEAVQVAIRNGYRHLDLAFGYGNESQVGEALDKLFKEGVVDRKDLFLTSKLGNTLHRQEDVEIGIKLSLERLGVDYLDLFLIHWPIAFTKNPANLDQQCVLGDDNLPMFDDHLDYVDTWKAMEGLVDRGLCKSIGISNFSVDQIDRLLKHCRITPAVNQVELHPYLVQKKLTDYCRRRGIVVEAYSPLGCPDRPWIQLHTEKIPILLEDETVREIAEKHQKNAGQILIRYQIQMGNVVLVKSCNEDRIRGNLDVFGFDLTNDEMEQLSGLDQNTRYVLGLWKDNNGHLVNPELRAKYYPFGNDGSKVFK